MIRERISSMWLLALAVVVLAVCVSSESAAEVFVVNSYGDAGDAMPGDGVCDDGSGLCTFRAALEEANAHFNDPFEVPDEIHFDFPGAGPHVVQPFYALPMIYDPVVINGYTQPGSSPNTNPPSLGSNAMLMVLLDGGYVSDVNGLELATGGCAIAGLAINGFSSHGISVTDGGPMRPTPEDPNEIVGCSIGSAEYGQANDVGIGVYGTIETLIGGGSPGALNVIANDGGTGINVAEIGVVSVAGNVISHNASGLVLTDSGYASVSDNVISLNGEGAWLVLGAGSAFASFAGNVIANNSYEGIVILGGAGPERGDGPYALITGNSIHSNGTLGIDLIGSTGVDPNDPGDADEGPNDMQNYPELHSALVGHSGTSVAGSLETLPDSSVLIEFFASPDCDESGHGEGMHFLGVTTVVTDGAGSGSFVASLPSGAMVGDYITATATLNDHTSEFSACVATEAASAVEEISWTIIKALYR